MTDGRPTTRKIDMARLLDAIQGHELMRRFVMIHYLMTAQRHDGMLSLPPGPGREADGWRP